MDANKRHLHIRCSARLAQSVEHETFKAIAISGSRVRAPHWAHFLAIFLCLLVFLRQCPLQIILSRYKVIRPDYFQSDDELQAFPC